MSSTNKTTNYELSQFIGTDKPAWLGDYNSDMNKIDAQMKLNADASAGAQGTATSASNAIGTLSSLNTDEKSTLVGAINEVDTHADTAQTNASSAYLKASANETAISALTDYFNLGTYNTYNNSNFTITAGGGTVNASSEISVARNSAGTLCKIYGNIVLDNTTTAGFSTVKLTADTGLRPVSRITVSGCGIGQTSGSGVDSLINTTTVSINPDGTLEFSYYKPITGTAYIRAIACLIFVKDFGDSE